MLSDLQAWRHSQFVLIPWRLDFKNNDIYAPGFRKEQKAYCLLFESVGIDGGIARIKQVPYKKLEQILEKKKW